MSPIPSTSSSEPAAAPACAGAAVGAPCPEPCPARTGLQGPGLEIAMLGVNHATAPVELRERLACDEEQARAFLLENVRRAGVAELLLLSTCNRTEIYLASCVPESALDAVLGRLLACKEVDDLPPAYTYRRTGLAAAAALFRVACGADSMVLGETEIGAQLKDAYRRTTECRASGPLLNRLCHMAFRCAKRVRTETAIGAGNVSVAAVVVELAARVFADLADKTVLVLGAGKIGELIARHFRKRGVGRLLIANRGSERARALAAAVEATAVPFEQLETHVTAADVVACATGSPRPLLSRDMLERARRGHGRGDLLLIDLGVPRDVASDAATIAGVRLYDIDAIQQLASRNLAERRGALPEAEQLIAAAVEEFETWYRTYRLSPMISTFLDRLEACRREELAAQPGDLSARELNLVQSCTRSLVKRIARIPIGRIRAATDADDDHARLAEALARLFDLEQQATRVCSRSRAGEGASVSSLPAAGRKR